MINAAEVIGSGTSILFVTLDSLRYDVARAALHAGQTPRLAKVLPGGAWEERRTPGTFTLPAHIAFFSGFLPKLPQSVQPQRPRARSVSGHAERGAGRPGAPRPVELGAQTEGS